MKESTMDTVDRISNLPDSIIHQVLSVFWDDPKTLVRVSVLSKNWSSLTASFPIFKFDSSYLRENLFEYVNYTTSRLCEQNVGPHTLDIHTSIRKPAQIDILDKCVRLVLQKKGVQVLVLYVPYYAGLPMYRLPNLLLSASSLLSLTIHQCELPSSLMVDALKFTSLKLLSLSRVPIDAEVITYLTTSCPLLEDISLENCYCFKRFCVYAHQSLQKVQIKCCYQIEMIDIEATNLRYLLLEGRKFEQTSMNFASCKKLQTFCYYGLISEPFLDILSSFLSIQNLHLCSRRDKWRLSFPSLRSLVLQSSCELDEIDIDAPNLLLFDFSGYSTHYGQLGCKSYLYVDDIWFEKLRFFLDKYQGIEVLKLHIRVAKGGINVKELMVFGSPPYELEHLQVALYSLKDLQAFEDVVDALLWCCRPLSLTLELEGHFISSENEGRHQLKYPYEKLLKQEDQGQIKLRILLTYPSEAEQHFTDLNSLVEALPLDAYTSYTITFIKEKRYTISSLDQLISATCV